MNFLDGIPYPEQILHNYIKALDFKGCSITLTNI